MDTPTQEVLRDHFAILRLVKDATTVLKAGSPGFEKEVLENHNKILTLLGDCSTGVALLSCYAVCFTILQEHNHIPSTGGKNGDQPSSH